MMRLNRLRGRLVIRTALAVLLAIQDGRARGDDSIKADGTLNSNPSVIKVSTADGKTTYAISGGASRLNDKYLFHSFSVFGLKSNEIAHFLNSTGAQSIFGRVTGGSQSSIDGLIKANANLWLINPSGIVFGPNARLDVAGTFHASTAKALTWGSGLEFSAVNPGDAPVLSVDVAPGLQFGDHAGMLSNEGVLVVNDGQQLLLSGGPNDRVSNVGTLTASNSAVTPDTGTSIVGPGVIIRSEGGVIQLGDASTTKRLMLNGTTIANTTANSDTPAAINLAGKVIEISESVITSLAAGEGAGAAINIGSTKPSLLTYINNSTITSSSSGPGNGGPINIGSAATTNLTNINYSQIISSSSGPGDGGAIALQGRDVDLYHSRISSQSSSAGKGGAINIGTTASSYVTYINQSQITSESSGAGNGGDINIGSATTTDLTDIYDSQITSSSSDAGNSGAISVSANRLILDQQAKLNTLTTATASGDRKSTRLNSSHSSVSRMPSSA